MKFFKEFKEFISRGNVVDMAVGVIIGGAFSAIVTALTNQILMPIINWILFLITGGKGLENIYTYLYKAEIEVETANGLIKEIDLANSIYIDWGAFITAIINFLLIALVLFLIIKAINTAHKHAEEARAKKAAEEAAANMSEEPAPAPAPAPEPTVEEKQLALLEEIKDLLSKK